MNNTDLPLLSRPNAGPAVATAPLATLVTDASGTVVSFSTEAERLLHCHAEAAVGRPLADLISPLPQAFPCSAESDCASSLFLTRGRRPDGTTFPLEVTLTQVALAGRRVVAATLRRPEPSFLSSQAALTDDQYRLFFEYSPQPMWVFDDETLNFLAVNQTAVDAYGFSRQEFLSMTVCDIRPPEDVPRFLQDVDRRQRRPDYRDEWRHRRKDGTVLWVEIRSHPITYEGRSARLVAATDITHRRAAEQALRENEERLRAVVNDAPLVLFALDADGVFTLAEGRVLEALGRRPGEAVGQSIFERYHDVPDTIRDAQRALAGEAVRSVRQLPHVAIDMRYTPVKDAAGRVVSVIGIGTDITDRLRMETELRHAQEELESRVQERTADLEVINDYLHYEITEREMAEKSLRRAEIDLLCSNRDLTQAYDATIEGWSRALDLRDHETEGHTRRVTQMTLHLARTMGVDEPDLVHVRRGALLHDIGKMGIPDRILLKPASLTEDEWAIMRRHPQFAYEMLSPIAFLEPALDIPWCHHERWDGTGYPCSLAGEDIPVAARIFSIADVWDALRSHRPYRQGWPADRVRAHIRDLSGRHFDPSVVEAFLQMDLSQF